MLIGLKQPLLKGNTIALTLRFAKAGAVTAVAEVLDPWSMAFDDR
jgi:copper(I)-binding protein